VAWNGRSAWEIGLGDRLITIDTAGNAISRVVRGIGRISAIAGEGPAYVIGDLLDADVDARVVSELLLDALVKPRAVKK
jgi:hypothetical protein